MTDGQADAVGCSLWAVAGVAGIIVGWFAGGWAIETNLVAWSDWVVRVLAVIVVSSVVTPVLFFPLLLVAKPFLERGESNDKAI